MRKRDMQWFGHGWVLARRALLLCWSLWLGGVLPDASDAAFAQGLSINRQWRAMTATDWSSSDAELSALQSIVYDSTQQRPVNLGYYRVHLASDLEDYVRAMMVMTAQGWQSVDHGHGPGYRTRHAFAYDSVRGRIVLFGGDLYSDIAHTEPVGATNDTWEWDGKNWQAKSPATKPLAEAGRPMVFDPVSKQMLLFQSAQTWAWDGVNWTKRSGGAMPPVSYTPIVYDSDRRCFVLFGGLSNATGKLTAETWEWTGSGNWVKRSPAAHPSARLGQQMAYDPKRKRTVLLGGTTKGAGEYLSDASYETWEWDGVNWKQVTRPAIPPVESLAAGFYFDSKLQKLALHELRNVRWLWDGKLWTPEWPTGNPDLSQFTLLFNPATRQFNLWGVKDRYRQPLYRLDWQGSKWTLGKIFDVAPSTKHVVFNSRAKRYFSFGGWVEKMGDLKITSDTWTSDGTTWVKLAPARRPPGRYDHAMAWDRDRDRVVVFGGRAATGLLRDTWEWDGTQWIECKPAQSPPPLAEAAMAYDAGRKRMVLYGGRLDGNLSGAGTRSSQTWEWDGLNWTQRAAGHIPGARSAHSMGYDEARRRIVIFGGEVQPGSTLNDLWQWDGNDWSYLNSGAAPPAVFAQSSMAYDSVTQSILFCGFNEARNESWTWALVPVKNGAFEWRRYR